MIDCVKKTDRIKKASDDVEKAISAVYNLVRKYESTKSTTHCDTIHKMFWNEKIKKSITDAEVTLKKKKKEFDRLCEKNEMNRISNTLNDLKEKFLEFVKHNDTKNASNFYQKHKEPIFFANKSEVYIDTNAKTIIIGPEAIKAAIEQNNWDVVDWMLDNGFECEGVGKTVSIFWIVYVGEMKDDEPNGKGRKTWSDGTVYEGSWKKRKRKKQRLLLLA